MTTEEKLLPFLKSFYPKHIVIEIVNEFAINVLRTLKEIVTKFLSTQFSELEPPNYHSRKIEVSETRAFYLSEKTTKNFPSEEKPLHAGMDIFALIPYSMACYVQDSLSECLKLRLTSTDVPTFKNEYFVI